MKPYSSINITVRQAIVVVQREHIGRGRFLLRKKLFHERIQQNYTQIFRV